MLIVDLAFLVFVAAILITWWRKPQATVTLAALSIALFAAVAWGFSMHRWQLVPGIIILPVLWFVYLVRKNRQWTKLPWISGTIMTLPALLSAFLIYTFPIRSLPEPDGQYEVGVRDFEIVDSSRTGLLGASQDEPRRLLVRVWYPATNVSDLTPRPYFSDLETVTTATGPGSLVGLPFYFTHVGNALTNSYEQAKPIPRSDLPVVIYSHGYTSFLAQNTVLMEHLASHGYLVYSLHHTGDGSPAVMPNDDVIPMDPELLASFNVAPAQDGQDPFVDQVTGDDFEIRRNATKTSYQAETQARLKKVSAKVWVEDREFLQQRLVSGKVPEAVQDIVVLGNYDATGEMGMSFGGTTSASFCMTNRRCAAAINLDGGDFHFNTFNRQMPVPFLMVYSDMNRLAKMVTNGEKSTGYGFNEFSYERHELAGFNEDIHRVLISGVTHVGISDFTWFVRRPLRNALLGTIDASKILDIQNDLVLGFFDQHLNNSNSNFPAMVLEKHPDHLQDYNLSRALREDWIERHPKDQSIRVRMETDAGSIEVAIYPERAPISANNFLAYVDAGHYDNTSLYRVTSLDRGSSISVVQGGRASAAMAGPADEVVNHYALLPPIQHERTDLTEINNERGTIAYARFAPGTAGSEIFFNVHDNEGLNSGDSAPHRDGLGYATFGRVISGLKVLEAIQALPTDRPTSIERLQGQLLSRPVTIKRAYRVSNED